MTPAQIEEAVANALVKAAPHLAISPEAHADQHEFIRVLMEREKRREELREKIKEHVGGWLIITILAGIGTGGYRAAIWIIQHLRVGQ